MRIIASTKRNLLEKIGEGTFREDLYYRLDVLRINIPPLRERLEDVPLLAEHLLKRIAAERPCRIEPDAIELLARHDWPGNVRELYHTLERAYLIGGGNITAEILAAEIGGPDPNQRLPVGGFQAAIDHAEKQLLQEALRNSGGNKIGRRRRAGHEALHLPRQAGQARAGVILEPGPSEWASLSHVLLDHSRS